MFYSTVIYELRNRNDKYLSYYSNLVNEFNSIKDIKEHYNLKIIDCVENLANSDKHYKFTLYHSFNPDLSKPDLSKPYSFMFTRLRLSSHSMPIELGRYHRIKRENRLCSICNEIGDERHYLYRYPTINKDGLEDLPQRLEELATYRNLPILLDRLGKYLRH